MLHLIIQNFLNAESSSTIERDIIDRIFASRALQTEISVEVTVVHVSAVEALFSILSALVTVSMAILTRDIASGADKTFFSVQTERLDIMPTVSVSFITESVVEGVLTGWKSFRGVVLRDREFEHEVSGHD